ncbi:MAG TPA: phospholipase D-like domain-containing protein [candidate division Zixibacteria bacterium]|nr:phospholipase D-like domain-containing protein [candidate division Zixibacteria bacterium]
MRIIFTDNITQKLLDVLRPPLSSANEIKFGVAFVKYSGLSLIEEDIKRCLKSNGKAEFLVGLDFKTTEPKALKTLFEISNSGLNLKLFCYSDPSLNDTPVYHPKIYLVRDGNRAVISIGSSNLTSGGLKGNVEVNAIIEANTDDEIVSDIYGLYNRLKFQKARFEPDLEYIEEYQETYKIFRKKSLEVLKDKSARNRVRALREREKVLPKPKPSRTELFGWQKLICERLPEGIFQPNDMYSYEGELRKFYPENRHIKDKIRQILQQLRDLGLLKYVGKNRWSKS